MTALSVSSSMTGWPSETLAPGAIIRRTRSPCEIFSPSSGSLNSASARGGGCGLGSGPRWRGLGRGLRYGLRRRLRCGGLSRGSGCLLRRTRSFGLRARHASRFGSLRASSVLDCENDLADFDLVAFFDADLLHGSADRRRHFHDGLVGFELHDRLSSADRGSGRDHQAHQVALFDVFSQLGKLEFNHCVCSSFVFRPFRVFWLRCRLTRKRLFSRRFVYALLADCRIRFFRIDSQFLDGTSLPHLCQFYSLAPALRA